MKTVSENSNRNVGVDKKTNKKGSRKFLQTLQPSGDKENLVGTGRFPESADSKMSKPQVKIAEVEVNSNEHKSLLAKINPSLYQKLIIDDLTSIAGPSEKYWEVIAERRRKALEDVLEQNRKLHKIIMALEEENASCKELLDQTTDLVNTFKELINEGVDEEHNKKLAKDEVDDKDSPTESKYNSDFSDSESD